MNNSRDTNETRVARGLHPESLAKRCDVCHAARDPQGGRDLRQYGRFMAHPACYQANSHLASLHRPPLDYAVVRNGRKDSSGCLISRMKDWLEAHELDRVVIDWPEYDRKGA